MEFKLLGISYNADIYSRGNAGEYSKLVLCFSVQRELGYFLSWQQANFHEQKKTLVILTKFLMP